jgi:hypothetical protein
VAIDCMNRKQEDVIAAVIGERAYQDRKWGTPREHPHEVGGWITLMRAKLDAAQNAWAGSRGEEKALHELRKVVAIGVACFEQHDVPSRGNPCPVSNDEAWREAGSRLIP